MVVYGTQSVTWADYPETSGWTPPSTPGGDGRSPGVVQRLLPGRGETDCLVDSGTGTVTGRAVGTCVVVLTVSKAGYDDFEATRDVTVDAGVMGAITWPNDAYASGNPCGSGDEGAVQRPDGRLPGRSGRDLLVDRFERLHGQSRERDGDRRGRRVLRGHGDLQQDGLHR